MPSNPYGFTATEYVSEGGCGSVMIKLSSRGWVVSLWSRERGYDPIPGDACATLAEALAAYQAWAKARLAGEVDW